jgi:hypothetical protein
MAYSLFCSDASIQSAKMPDHPRIVPANPDSMGNAINAACALINGGSIVWKLKGSDGFMMERIDIETECRRREAEIPPNPDG